ncbi:hypothetical protein [Desulfuribacillus alkaliarsenatis]|nr:hypothetical protein [Desulfuribacillus alkaliarsenatis]
MQQSEKLPKQEIKETVTIVPNKKNVYQLVAWSKWRKLRKSNRI